MDTMQRQFTPHIRNNALIQGGQAQVRHRGEIATHSIGPGARQTRRGHASGWIKTGDTGFVNAPGLRAAVYHCRPGHMAMTASLNI